MDEPKPQPKEYVEGPEAALRFDALVKKAVTVPHSEIQKREEVWQKESAQQKKRR